MYPRPTKTGKAVWKPQGNSVHMLKVHERCGRLFTRNLLPILQEHTGKIGFYQFLRMFRQHLIDLEVRC